MASKRFLIVPEDSSAASMPLPGATMARATLLRSARFIDASFRALLSLQVKVDGSQAAPGKTSKKTSKKTSEKTSEKTAQANIQVNAKKTCAGAGEAGGSFRSARPSRDLRI